MTPKNKLSHAAVRLMAGGLLFAAASKSLAAEIAKLNNADALNVGTSWAGGAVPTASDVAAFDGEVLGDFFSVNTGAALSFGGLKFTDSVPATIGNGALTINGSDTTRISTGASGIDLSGATQDVEIWSGAGLSNDFTQIWRAPKGRALHFNAGSTLQRSTGAATTNARGTVNFSTESAAVTGSYAQSGSNTITVTAAAHGLSVGDSVRLKFSGGPANGTYLVASVVDANSFTLAHKDSATASGTVTYWPAGAIRAENFTTAGQRLGVYATYNNFDFAYLSLVGDTWLQFTDSEGAGITYTTNPSDGGVTTAAVTVDAAVSTTFMNNPVDVVNSNGFSTATAFRLINWMGFTGGNTANSGLRFNTPHATPGTPWVVDMTANGGMQNTSARVYIGAGAFSVLVTPNVGASNVEINGGANTIGFRYNSNNNSEFIIHQHNTQGDLIMNASFSNSGSITNTHWVKTGAGRVILDNAGFVSSGTVSLQQGTVEVGRNNARGTFNNRPIVNNGTLVFKRNDAVSHSGVISGAGSLESAMTSPGSLTLTGANTYTGTTTVTSGVLVVGHATALGAGPVTLNGGTLRYGTGITTDISSRTVSLPANSTLDTNGNNITFANSIGASGAGSLTKTGAGTLTLSGANTYTGSTTVSAGTLAIANTGGSATGAGNVTVSSAATLTGTGSLTGSVTISSGGILDVGGTGVGTLNAGGLALNSGALLTIDTNGSTADKVVVAPAGPLTINGGGITLRGTALNTTGSYRIVQGTSSVGGSGVSALSVVNPTAGYNYTFASDGSGINLVTALAGLNTQWTSTTGGAWNSGANWGGTIPGSTSGDTASFTTQLATPSTVTLPGNITLGGLVFTSTNAYTLVGGQPADTITFNNGASPAALNVNSGDHVVSAPVVLASNLNVTTATASAISLNGVVSGSGGITKAGAGTLRLAGNNTFSGDVVATDGVILFTHASGLGAGNITLNGGSIAYGAGITTDLSTKAITVGLNGGSIDTNGNNITFGAPIGNGGSGLLTKTGAGTLTLASGNTFAGGTAVIGGTLVLPGSNTLGGPSTIGNATLRIDGDAALGANTSGLTFSPGAGNTAHLEVTGATVSLGAGRGLTLSSGNASIDTGANAVTVNGTVTGAGALVKDGSGSLTLNGNSDHTGGVTINSGTLVLGSSGTAGLGAGAVTMNGTSTLNLGARNLPNALVVNGGSTTVLSGDGGGASALNAISGNGTLNVTIASGNVDLRGVLTSFNGTLGISSAAGNFRFNGTAGGSGLTLNLGTGSTSVRNGATVLTLGALSGNAGSILGGSGGGQTQAVTWTVGAKNLSTTFAGAISNGAGATGLTKVGTGTLTLSGTSTHTGNTTVNEGVLRVDGSLALNATSGTASAVTVAAGGTLAGSGTIVGNTTVNGILRPALGGSTLGGKLSFDGTLALDAASTTQVDFTGAFTTGIRSTLSSGVTYGGTLKLNFPGNVYNGSYTLFELTGAPNGAFSAVTVTTSTATDAPLAASGSSWSGTVGVVTYVFNASTGVLTVSGGTNAVVPGVATLSASAGNATVNLSWTAASNADTYIVKRSLTVGGPYTTIASDVVTRAYSDTLLTNGTTYYYVVQAKDSASGLTGVDSNEVSATPVEAPSHTSLQNWRFEQFGVYDDDGTVLAGNTEDFDGDGLANILEYALNTNPKVANASPVVVGKSGNNLTLTYPRRSTADAALTYTVQGSSDLTTGFTTAGGATNTVGSTSTYTDNVDVSAAGVRRFLRLSVTYTAP